MYYTFLLIHRERETEQNHVWTEENLSKGAYGGMYMYEVTSFSVAICMNKTKILFGQLNCYHTVKSKGIFVLFMYMYVTQFDIILYSLYYIIGIK